MELQVLDWTGDGPIPYVAAWERQQELVLLRQRNEIPDTLLLLEHPPTVTYGRGANPANLRLSPDEYARRGIALVATNRGGDVTYHGPGQLVGYPILHLGENNRDLHRYVRRLEEALIRAACDLGVANAGRAPWHAGVWVGEGYLAALGVRVARWVTHHGWALNVTDEVQAGFATIVPCGVAGRPVVSLSGLLGRPVAMRDVVAAVQARFVEVMGAASADIAAKYRV